MKFPKINCVVQSQLLFKNPEKLLYNHVFSDLFFLKKFKKQKNYRLFYFFLKTFLFYTSFYKNLIFKKLNYPLNFIFNRGGSEEVFKTFFKKLFFFKLLTTRHKVIPKPWWTLKRKKKKKYFYKKELIHINNLYSYSSIFPKKIFNLFLKEKFITFSVFFKKLFEKSKKFKKIIFNSSNKKNLHYNYIFNTNIPKFFFAYFRNFFFFKKNSLCASYLNIEKKLHYKTTLKNHLFFLKISPFIFFTELGLIGKRKNFLNYYTFKTFRYSYHSYWKTYSYKEVLFSLKITKIFSTPSKYSDNLFHTSLNKDFLISDVFDFTSTYIHKWIKFKYWFLVGRDKRYKKKVLRWKKLEYLSYFLRLFSGESYKAKASLWNDSDTFLCNVNLTNLFFLKKDFWTLFDKYNFNYLNNYQFFFKNESLSKNSSLTTQSEFFKSNYLPILYFSDEVKYVILAQKKLIKDPVSHKYLQQYLVNFISKYSSMKSLFILQSNINVFSADLFYSYKVYIAQIVSYFSKINKRFFRFSNLSKFIEIFSYSLYQKDLLYFTQFFKKNMEETSFKKHKKVLYSLNFLIKKFFSKIFFYTSVLGFKFEISGKISVTGNSKTRNKIIKYGQYSLTNKSLKIDYSFDVIRTTTGVMGFKTFITY